MEAGYKILWKGGTGELVEKKSRFIATTEPVRAEGEAAAFVERMRKKYWDASHNCYAYVTGPRGQLQKCSDDGEPSQTAGRPMLDVLLGEGIRDVCVVVTRYFGGTLLGTGGLVRAYSAAVAEGLKGSQVLWKCPGRRITISTDYGNIGKIQYILAQMDVPVLDTQYTDKVEVAVMAHSDQVERLTAQITEATSGRAGITLGDETYFGLAEGKVVLL